jgi:hypothetical protein
MRSSGDRPSEADGRCHTTDHPCCAEQQWKKKESADKVLSATLRQKKRFKTTCG